MNIVYKYVSKITIYNTVFICLLLVYNFNNMWYNNSIYLNDINRLFVSYQLRLLITIQLWPLDTDDVMDTKLRSQSQQRSCDDQEVSDNSLYDLRWPSVTSKRLLVILNLPDHIELYNVLGKMRRTIITTCH